jgi:hypothetical protein
MRQFLTRRRPSPAMAVAFVALLAALSGTAVALPGKNTVDSGDIKKNAVKSSDIAKGAVKTADLAKNAVRSAKVRNNSLTGNDVNESTFGKVPSAATADSATTANSANTANTANSATNAGNASTVGGNAVRAFSLVGASPIAETLVLDLNGLQLFASCAGGDVTLTARTTTADSEISGFSHDASAGTEVEDIDDNFAPGDSFVMPQASPHDEIGQGRFTGGNARFVDFTYNQEDDTGTNDCLMHGFATGN